MPFNCIFYCGSFDIYHSGLARSVLFFVTVYIVKISTVHKNVFVLKNNKQNKLLLGPRAKKRSPRSKKQFLTKKPQDQSESAAYKLNNKTGIKFAFCEL